MKEVAWLAAEVIKSSQLFFHNGGMLDVKKLAESDLLYEVWGFLKTITNGIKITTEG